MPHTRDKNYPWSTQEPDDLLRVPETARPTQDAPAAVKEAPPAPEVEPREAVASSAAQDRAARVALLASVEPFDLFEERWLEAISGLMTELAYEETQDVYRAGDLSDAAYVVLEGEVAVFSDTVGEPVQLFARLEPGEIFGEVGVLDRCRRVATARASKNTKVLRLEGCDLQRLGRANPNFGLKLAQRALLRYMRESSKILQLGRRSDVRVRTHRRIHLIAGDRDPLEVEIENLSIGGCCLRGVPDSWFLNESTPISLRLPDGTELLRTRGRMAWRKNQSVGIAFTGISRSHGQQIDEALQRLLEPVSEVADEAEALEWKPSGAGASVS